MNREIRTGRPFSIPHGVGDVFRNSCIRFGNKTVYADSRIQWDDPQSLVAQSVILEWCPEGAFDDFRAKLERASDEMGIAPISLGLIVTVASRYLSFVDTVFETNLTDIDDLERELDISTSNGVRPAGLRTASRGAKIEAYFLLWNSVPPSDLRPWRKGTWLARASFTIATDYQSSLFRPLELDDKNRRALGLPREAMRYVELPEVWGPYNPDDPPRVYLDKDIMAEVALRRNAPISRVVQLELAGTFMRAVLAEASANREEWRDQPWNELKETLLGRVVRGILGKEAQDQDCEAWLVDLGPTQLEKRVSECESVMKMRSSVRKAFREDD